MKQQQIAFVQHVCPVVNILHNRKENSYEAFFPLLFIIELCSSACGVNRTIPCCSKCCIPCHGMFALRVFKLFSGKCTKAYLQGTHLVRFAPDSWMRYVACTNGAQYVGLCSLQALIEVWYSSLWHALDHIGKWSALPGHASRPVQFGMATVHVAQFKIAFECTQGLKCI